MTTQQMLWLHRRPSQGCSLSQVRGQVGLGPDQRCLSGVISTFSLDQGKTVSQASALLRVGRTR